MNTDQFFAKEDTSDDSLFYKIPRLVTHIDDNACMVLKGYYRSLLKDGDAVLDLMSSWVSHLPEDINYSKVSAQGMNKLELEANLSKIVKDCNKKDEEIANLQKKIQLHKQDSVKKEKEHDNVVEQLITRLNKMIIAYEKKK